MIPRIVVLTGERGAGKTAICRKVIALAQERGYACAGVITLAYPDNRLDVFDVRTGAVRRLALPSQTRMAVVQGRFHFDPEALLWGGNVLAHATPCHLLVVDELGPLEVLRGEGWGNAFDTVRGANFGLALVVARPELVDGVQSRLPPLPTVTITVSPLNRERLPAVLLEILDNTRRQRQELDESLAVCPRSNGPSEYLD